MNIRLAIVAVALPAALVACGGSSSSAVVDTRDSGAVTHQLTDNDDGSTVDAHVGDSLTVTLHNTYWQFQSPPGQVLQQRGQPAPSPGGSACPDIPGTGCGTVVADYLVSASGTVTLAAHRESCGEAMRCTGSNGGWSVTVRATR
jgi:hypothetical protein